MTDQSAQTGHNPSRPALMLRAFKYKNYRLFFGGQSISLIGTWMQSVAMSWLVYRLTGSALLLGVVGFASQIPVFLLAPVTGVAADRYNRYKILIITQTSAMFQAFILAFLVLSGRIQTWHIIVLSLFLGLLNSFDIPARQSFVIELVEKKEDLGNAIALNSSMFNVARLAGPAISGVLISAVGEGMCFFLNGLSYVAVLAALFSMDFVREKKKSGSGDFFKRLKEGFDYTFGFAPIRCIILLLALTSLTSMSYTVLMPVLVKEILRGGPRTLGFLMGCSGLGALTAALTLAVRKSAAGLEKKIPLAGCLFGAGLIALSFSRSFALSAFFISLASFGMINLMASSNTIIQTVVEDDKRGRVMAFYAMAFMGMAPFGSLLAGFAASKIGAPYTILLSGLAAIAGAAVFFSRLGELREAVRPVYRKMGIISETGPVDGG